MNVTARVNLDQRSTAIGTSLKIEFHSDCFLLMPCCLAHAAMPQSHRPATVVQNVAGYPMALLKSTQNDELPEVSEFLFLLFPEMPTSQKS